MTIDASIDGTPKFKVPAYKGEDYSTSAVYEHLCELFRDQGTAKGALDGGHPQSDNIARAKFAAEGIRAYAKETGIYQGESVLLAISDLMNDLRHLLDFTGLDDDSDPDILDGYAPNLEVLAANDVHYEAEIRGVF